MLYVAIFFVIFTLLSESILWVFYLAVMKLSPFYKAGKLTGSVLVYAKIVLYVGYLMDFYCNVVTFTIRTFDLPRELTVTARLKRYRRAGREASPRLFDFAESYRPMLDPFDPSGKHL